jgi:hypothetical protein
MSKFVFTDAVVFINTVDLSDHVESVTLATSADAVELTAMGATAREYGSGLKNGSLSVTFFQDYAASEVDVTLFSLVGAAAFACTVKPTSAAISATNPEFQFNALLTDYSGPVDASVGDAAKASATFQLTTAVTRDVTA